LQLGVVCAKINGYGPVVINIFADGGRYQTTDGLGIGSTLTDLKETPKVTCQAGDPGTTCVLNPDHPALLFGVKDGRVRMLAIVPFSLSDIPTPAGA
jgi:hypothetical protein